MIKKSIVIIGAGKEQESAYLVAKKLNLITIGVDKNKNAPALKYADYKINVSVRNISIIEKTLKSLLKENKIKKINGIFTLANDVPFTVASLSKTFKTKSISVQSSLQASNKILMKKRFNDSKVSTPVHKVVSSLSNFYKVLNNFKNDFIIKPSDGRGSRGVYLLTNKMKKGYLKKFFLKSYYESTERKVIIEEFLDGPQISTEGFFYKKKYRTIAYADRNYSNLSKTKPYILENGGSMPSKIDNKIKKKIDELIKKACDSVNINWGTIKSDIVIHKNQPCIIELAARISGGYMASHSIPLVYNFNLIKYSIKECCNLKNSIPKIQKKNKLYMCQRFLFAKTGRIKIIRGINKLKKNNEVYFYNFLVKNGKYQKKIQSHSDRSGMIITFSKSYKDAIKQANKCINNVKIKYY